MVGRLTTNEVAQSRVGHSHFMAADECVFCFIRKVRNSAACWHSLSARAGVECGLGEVELVVL